MRKQIKAALRRLFSPCPLWHRTKDRIWRAENQRQIFECALCGRDTGEALLHHPRPEPIEPARAEPEPWFKRKVAGQ